MARPGPKLPTSNGWHARRSLFIFAKHLLACLKAKSREPPNEGPGRVRLAKPHGGAVRELGPRSGPWVEKKKVKPFFTET